MTWLLRCQFWEVPQLSAWPAAIRGCEYTNYRQVTAMKALSGLYSALTRLLFAGNFHARCPIPDTLSVSIVIVKFP
jgi:hypothetical protein